MTYNATASRQLISALRDTFADWRFDEYGIIATPGLTFAFLFSRRMTQRVFVAHWLRRALDQDIGLQRDETWFQVVLLPALRVRLSQHLANQNQRIVISFDRQ